MSEQVAILIDADPIEGAPALDVKKFVEEKAERLKACYKLLERNRMLKMGRAKRDYDRKIKKSKYNLGNLVLMSPHWSKKVSQLVLLRDTTDHLRS